MSIFKRFASLVVAVALVVSISIVAQGFAGGLGSWESPAGATPPAPSGDGVVFAWGSNTDNALGLPFSLNPPTLSSVPVATHLAQDGYTARAVAAGNHDVLVATDSGTTHGWGWNASGQLGNGTTALALDYTQVALPRRAELQTVSSGFSHSLGIDTTGRVWAWGNGAHGLLGQGNEDSSTTPVLVTLPQASPFDPPVTAVAVAASNTTSYAVGSNGMVYMWGQDHDGTDACSLWCSFRPRLVPGISDIANIEAGVSDYATALGNDGLVWRVQGGYPPEPVANGTLYATQIASTFGRSYAIGLDGHVYAWGLSGSAGEFGDGTRDIDHFDDPVRVHLPVTAVAISATYYNGYAIGEDGKLYAWGTNFHGELGIGSTTGPQMCGAAACATTPVQVALPPNYMPVGLPSEGQSPHTAYAILQYVPSTTPSTISGTPQSPATVGSPYSFGFTLGGAPAPTTNVSAGTLPPGVTLSTSGILSGTPTTPGSYSFTVTASNGAGPNTSTAVTIVVQPSISVGSSSILEGDNGTRVLKFPVTLSNPSNAPVTVQYSLQGAPSGGTATGAKKAGSGIDFLNNGGAVKTLTFALAGTGLTPVQKDISVTVSGDTAVEGVETFTVRLQNPSSGYALRQSTAIGTILNDDVGIGSPRLGIGDAAVVSSSTAATKLNFPVTLSVAAQGSFTVHYVVTPETGVYSSTAAGHGDFGGKKSGTLTFAVGNTTKTISLPVWPHLAGSGVKTLRVELSAVSDTGIVLLRNVATGSIAG